MADITAVDETIKRLASYKGVRGILVATADGVPVRTTLEQDAAQQYAALATTLASKARSMVREIASDDELQFLRVRSRRGEIMIAPGADKERQYCLVVVQNPVSE
ncbi:LC7 [Auxenochlorella protothecoides x Auxenochlorella symbiontica]|uniref:Dynein light chain roadblock n=1 Tax=Auxenochlorella protothecoides TaxID=3075 RepID=A0A087SID1_AUXPR|nr:Dynein light chain roadblock-type 2 [Auxenochlorella protothecoides]KFM25485.1 Dynein light chain roadblock-type 2 [Auxenochlorella protothecoides]RMZ54678.1 hypothetical protein APUTEX25_003056 [Auxenochlorella protothecoides]|eukprot:RMZ54678.1 hypothetical protein APUTEX25_003056 [Auxenochlorella protothecoides]